MEKALKNVIKNYNKLSDEDLNEFLSYLQKDDGKEEEKTETKKEEVKKETKETKTETKEEVKDFVTNDQLKTILEEVLGKVALKEDVEKIKVDKKKAKAFGTDGKVIVNEVDDRDSRLASILAGFNN